jgi:HSP20 family protein
MGTWDPWQELEELRGDLERRLGLVGGRQGSDQTSGELVVRPLVVVEEGEEAFGISVDLPDVSPEAVEVEVHERALTIRGRRRVIDQIVRYERSLTLPDSADTEGIQAESRDGVLRLRIPKQQRGRPRRVQVQPAAQQSVAGTAPAGEPPAQEPPS